MTDELRHCGKCNYETANVVAVCPDCGRRLSTARQVRRLGWGQVFIGLLLAGGLGTILANLAPPLLNPGAPAADGSSFTGTQEQGRLAVMLLALAFAFGLACMVSGVWQIRTGRRSKRILQFCLMLLILLAVAGWSARSALDG